MSCLENGCGATLKPEKIKDKDFGICNPFNAYRLCCCCKIARDRDRDQEKDFKVPLLRQHWI